MSGSTVAQPIKQVLKGTGIELVNTDPAKGNGKKFTLRAGGKRFGVASDDSGNVTRKAIVTAAKAARVPVPAFV